jgi:hypothetical protein
MFRRVRLLRQSEFRRGVRLQQLPWRCPDGTTKRPTDADESGGEAWSYEVGVRFEYWGVVRPKGRTTETMQGQARGVNGERFVSVLEP